MTWDWAWSVIIPTTMLHLGAWCLIVGLALQFFTPEKNATSSCILMIIGGFGVGGAAAGWIGSGLTSSVGAVATWTGQFTQTLTGVSFPFLLFAIPAFFAWRQVKGGKSSIKSGSSGKSSSSGRGGSSGKRGGRAKQFFYSCMYACLGTVLAAIPPLFSWADTGVYYVGTTLLAITPA